MACLPAPRERSNTWLATGRERSLSLAFSTTAFSSTRIAMRTQRRTPEWRTPTELSSTEGAVADAAGWAEKNAQMLWLAFTYRSAPLPGGQRWVPPWMTYSATPLASSHWLQARSFTGPTVVSTEGKWLHPLRSCHSDATSETDMSRAVPLMGAASFVPMISIIDSGRESRQASPFCIQPETGAIAATCLDSAQPTRKLIVAPAEKPVTYTREGSMFWLSMSRSISALM